MPLFIDTNTSLYANINTFLFISISISCFINIFLSIDVGIFLSIISAEIYPSIYSVFGLLTPFYVLKSFFTIF